MLRTLRWLSLLAAAAPLTAQCTNVFGPASAIPGVAGEVYATVVWDPDGAGPQGPMLVVGGRFSAAGDVAAQGIAGFDLTTRRWHSFAGGVSGAFVNTLTVVSALAVLPDGRLVAGGSFTQAGMAAAAGVAAWDGTSWAAVGGGTDREVYSLLVTTSGELVIGGVFSQVGGVLAKRVARWNGSTWAPFGFGLDHSVNALVQMPNGELIAGGSFWQGIKRWTGSSWSVLGTGIYNGTDALTIAPSGELIAGGYEGVHRWTGQAWIELGSLQHVQALQFLANGELVAAGTSLTGGLTPMSRIARWSGSAWGPLGEGLWSEYGTSWGLALTTLPGGELVAGGVFQRAGTAGVANVAVWDGSDWGPLSRDLNGSVDAFAALPGGELVVGGDFTTAADQVVERLAIWDGALWSPLAGGGANARVRALLRLDNGDLVVGGDFTAVGGVPANRVARWDGATWSTFGSGLNGRVRAIASLANGDVVVGGDFTQAGGAPTGCIARWNGSTWSDLGGGIPPYPGGGVYSLQRLANGDLIVGGAFWTAGGASIARIARWDGAAWSPFGLGINGTVRALTTAANGDLLAAGSFWAAGGVPALGVARWHGGAWSALGQGPAVGTGWVDFAALTFVPGGDLLVGGRLNPGTGNERYLARWNGSTWTELASRQGPAVGALAMLGAGELAVGHNYDLWGGGGGSGNAPYLAVVVTDCPPAVQSFGTGCVGSGGPNTLVTTSLPWLGTTFRARASGLVSNSVALALWSFQQTSVQLSTLLPQGVPGCDVLVPDEILIDFASVGGVADTAVSIPMLSSLIGATFYHQVVPVEFGPAIDITAVTSTNGLALTVGRF
ncbi:MAG: hypothetical protein R3F29_02450 [Planctomycetota bacterium]